MISRTMKATAFALLVGCWAPHAGAVPVLDQSFVPGALEIGARIGLLDFGGGGTFVYDVFQSFTVGITGVLDSIDIYVDKNGTPTQNLVVDIVSGTTPAGASLASSFLAPEAVPTTPGFVTFDLSGAGLVVTAGDFLGIRMSSLQSFLNNINEYVAFGNSSGGYAGGAGAHIYNGTPQPEAGDFYFNTYVSVVPEPATVALFTLALFGVGVGARRRAG